MTFAAGEGVVTFKGDFGPLQQSLRAITSTLGSIAGGGWSLLALPFKLIDGLISKIFNLKNAIIGLAGAGAVGLLVKSLDESDATFVKINSTIQSTNKAAGLTAKEVESIVQKYEKITNLTDEQIRAGAALQLTFTNIKKDVFEESLAIMLDMSQAMGTDMKGQAIQLGKALNDPLKGMSALAEVGVTFTDQQKKQIANFQAIGDMVSAQRIILAELNREFGGVATNLAKMDTAKFTALRKTFEDISELISRIIIPSIANLAGNLNTMLENNMDNIAKWAYGFKEYILSVGRAFASLWKWATSDMKSFIDSAKQLFVSLGEVITSALELAFITAKPKIINTVKDIGEGLKNAIFDAFSSPKPSKVDAITGAGMTFEQYRMSRMSKEELGARERLDKALGGLSNNRIITTFGDEFKKALENIKSFSVDMLDPLNKMADFIPQFTNPEEATGAGQDKGTAALIGIKDVWENLALSGQTEDKKQTSLQQQMVNQLNAHTEQFKLMIDYFKIDRVAVLE